ncbi:MAG TPA: DUF2970 domain-containing protein [Burkholderiales bacterium]|nr:DUF2970 domain-containing protein [Burkholderiales bacterium]
MKRASFRDTVKTVLFGAIGIRKRTEHEKLELNPVHLIITAIIFVVLFILTIRTIVRIVIS